MKLEDMKNMLKTYKIRSIIRSLSLFLQSKKVSFKSTLKRDHYPYDFVFIVGTMSIRLSEEEHKYLAGVYTWVGARYVFWTGVCQ